MARKVKKLALAAAIVGLPLGAIAASSGSSSSSGSSGSSSGAAGGSAGAAGTAPAYSGTLNRGPNPTGGTPGAPNVPGAPAAPGTQSRTGIGVEGRTGVGVAPRTGIGADTGVNTGNGAAGNATPAAPETGPGTASMLNGTGLNPSANSANGSRLGPTATPSAAGPERSPAQAMGPTTVRQAQQALNVSGASLQADGLMGPHTKQAIRQFQRDHHLAVTGRLDNATRERLGMP